MYVISCVPSVYSENTSVNMFGGLEKATASTLSQLFHTV